MLQPSQNARHSYDRPVRGADGDTARLSGGHAARNIESGQPRQARRDTAGRRRSSLRRILTAKGRGNRPMFQGVGKGIRRRKESTGALPQTPRGRCPSTPPRLGLGCRLFGLYPGEGHPRRFNVRVGPLLDITQPIAVQGPRPWWGRGAKPSWGPGQSPGASASPNDCPATAIGVSSWNKGGCP